MPTRRASILLMAVAMIAVLVMASYGFLVSTRLSLDASRSANLSSLAQVAARAGLAHACGALDAGFLSTPRLPTNLRQAWRTGFLPIDSYAVGKGTATTVDDAPQGAEFSPEDGNDNDTKTENLLTELYAMRLQKSGSSEIGAYYARSNAFRSAASMQPGGGRYIEPGCFDRDLVGRPISFQLTHPSPAVPGDPDPAKAVGENYTPDIDDALYLTAGLGRAGSRAEARYRLRYAIAIEDLAGHLLASPQGPYVPGLVSALTAIVPDRPAQDLRNVVEIDPVRSDRYADAFTAMCSSVTGASSFWGWMAWQGIGAKPSLSQVGSDDASYAILRSFSGLVPQIAVDYDYTAAPPPGKPDRRCDNLMAPSAAAVHYALLGAPCSFESMQAPNGYADNSRNVSTIFTPFGRAPSTTAPPDRWDYGQTDTPWRLNLPTATPRAIATMLYAYLPQEFYSLDYPSRTRQPFAGFDADGNPTWGLTTTETLVPPVKDAYPCFNLFNNRPPFSTTIFGHLGHDYPGTTPTVAWSAWDTGLGRLIDANDLGSVVAPSGDVSLYARVPLWGQGGSLGSYHWRLGSDVVEKQEMFPGGERWVRKLSGSTVPLTTANGFAYDSYWLDLATAFTHAIAVAQFAWQGETGASWSGAPTAGATRYPDGTATIDQDLDGDGVADSPSRFDTVQEVDYQFVRNLGEYPEDYATGTRPGSTAITSGDDVASRIGNAGLYLRKASAMTAVASLVTGRVANTIKSLRTVPRDLPHPGTLPTPALVPISGEQAGMMELVLNDMRMSFFGASPQYPDFHPMDFDDDGTVRCSAYPGGSAAADVFTGKGPVPPAARRFSQTGYIVFQKSRYFRINCRGEVFDLVRQRPVADVDLEAAYVLDPDGQCFDLADAPIPGAPALSTRILYQRWLANRYRGTRSRAALP
jgi:hypothetical protein